MKKVKLDLAICDTPPQELLSKIESARISKALVDSWGTAQCRKLLDELVSDTRNNTRKGFPNPAGEALIALTVLHEAKMKDLGFEDFADSEFMVNLDLWRVPKNF